MAREYNLPIIAWRALGGSTLAESIYWDPPLEHLDLSYLS